MNNNITICKWEEEEEEEGSLHIYVYIKTWGWCVAIRDVRRVRGKTEY
jgi:hypothetical protein